MPLIEGLGDEVTLVLGSFLLCIVLTLAWFSTHTADIPLLREVGVIVVELSQRRSRTRGEANGESSGQDGDGAAVEQDSTDPSSTSRQGDGEESSLDGNINQALNSNRESSERDITDALRNAASEARGVSVRDNANAQSRIADESTILTSSQSLLPEVAEAFTNEATQGNVIGAEATSEQSPTGGEGTASSLPKASVIVEENKGFSHNVGQDRPTEDEVRRRRVQYFEMSNMGSAGAARVSELTAGGESGSPIDGKLDNNESSSLSENLSGDSVGARHNLGQDSVHSDSPNSPVLDINNRLSEAPLDDGPSSTRATSQQASASARDSGDAGIPVQQQESSNDQTSNAPGEASSRIRVKLKYMNETQRLVYASPDDTIGDFRRTHFQPELQDNKWVRFIYNGQDLRDDARTLHACNIGDNCTMHCLITAQAQPSSSREASLDEEDDSFMGAMMYPLFTIVLLIVWYFRFTYRQYFSAMSTVCLIGISFLLALSYISSLRTAEHASQQQRTGAAEGGQQRQEHPHAE